MKGPTTSMRIMLLGYYGHQNLGDDLMLEGLLDELCAEPSLERITVVVKDNYFAPRPQNVTFIRAEGPAAKLRVLAQTARSRYIVLGGGTCLYEMPSGDNAGLYGMRRIVRTSAFLRTRTAFCCIGIGDIHTEDGRGMIRSIIDSSSHLSFRDEESCRTAGTLVQDVEKLSLGGDLVFLNPLLATAPPRRRAYEGIRTIGFSGVHSFKDEPGAADAAARNLQALSAAFGARIVFIPMHRGTLHDHAYHQEVARRLPGGVTVEFAEYSSPAEALDVIRSIDFLVGMRLHSIVLADLLSVPNLAVEYSPKVGAYVRKTDFHPALRLAQSGDAFDAGRVWKITEAYRDEPDRLAGFLGRERAAAKAAVQRLVREMRGTDRLPDDREMDARA